MHTRSRGRGRNYTALRGLVELACELCWAGGWPARIGNLRPDRPRLARFELALLEPGSPRLRLGLASDLHIGPTTAPRQIELGLELLDRENLDVLLLGGDYVFLEATPKRSQMLARLVDGVRAPLKLAVLGNHDLWTHHQRLERALESAGVRLLVNETVPLAAPHDGVHIVGLDEPWTGIRAPERALASTRDANVRVVLCHSPDGLDMLDQCDGPSIDLYVCGHTHGGHVALPGGVPIILPPGSRQRAYAHGLRSAGTIARHVYTSRGLGNTELPFRLFAPPDVALFELTSRPAHR